MGYNPHWKYHEATYKSWSYKTLTKENVGTVYIGTGWWCVQGGSCAGGQGQIGSIDVDVDCGDTCDDVRSAIYDAWGTSGEGFSHFSAPKASYEKNVSHWSNESGEWKKIDGSDAEPPTSRDAVCREIL